MRNFDDHRSGSRSIRWIVGSILIWVSLVKRKISKNLFNNTIHFNNRTKSVKIFSNWPTNISLINNNKWVEMKILRIDFNSKFHLEFGENFNVGFYSWEVCQWEIDWHTNSFRFVFFSQVSLDKFIVRVTNNDHAAIEQESKDVRKFLGITKNHRDIPLRQVWSIDFLSFRYSFYHRFQCISYLWSDANSAFDPTSRSTCYQDMDQPLTHYWISSSHNT